MSLRNHFLYNQVIRKDPVGYIYSDFLEHKAGPLSSNHDRSMICQPPQLERRSVCPESDHQQTNRDPPASFIVCASKDGKEGRTITSDAKITVPVSSPATRHSHEKATKPVSADGFETSPSSPTTTLCDHPKPTQPSSIVQRHEGFQSLAKIPKSEEDMGKNEKQKSVFGPLFLFGSSVPPQTEISTTNAAPVSAVEVHRTEEDALDRIFNTVERYSCQSNAHVLDHHSNVHDSNGAPPAAIREPSVSSGRSFIFGRVEKSKPSMSKKKVPHHSREENDVLDNVFEGMERLACPGEKNFSHFAAQPRSPYTKDAMNKKTMPHHSQEENDALDTVFEGMERLACPGGKHFSHFAAQPRSPYTKDAMDRDAETVEPFNRHGRKEVASRDRQQPKEVSKFQMFSNKYNEDRDVLDARVEGMDRDACRDDGNVAFAKTYHRSPHENDALDDVFEAVERFACHGGSVEVESRHCHKEERSPTEPQFTRVQVQRGNPDRLVDRLGLRTDALYGREGDILDVVFGKVELTACGHQVDEYRGISPYQAAFDIERHNSLVELAETESHSYDVPRRTKGSHNRRQPSSGDVQPRLRKKEQKHGDDLFESIFKKVDYVITNVEETTTCH